MTIKQAIRDFISLGTKFSDYYEMQFAWECYKDSLNRDGVITDRQRDHWGNPCTPEGFDKWNKRHFGI